MNKVIRDNRVGVLYSPGYGAGWYTWNTDFPECIFHPKLIEMVESNQNNLITDTLMEELGFKEFYCGGAINLDIQWIPIGTNFMITEYDGYESVSYIDNIQYFTA